MFVHPVWMETQSSPMFKQMQDLMLANLEQFVTVQGNNSVSIVLKICIDFLVILNHLDAMEDLKPIFCSAAFRMNIK